MKLPLGQLFLWLLSLNGAAAHLLINGTSLQEQGKLEHVRRFQFPCELEMLSNSPSSSVHTLRPSDIKAVTAIGSLQTTLVSGMSNEDLLQRCSHPSSGIGVSISFQSQNSRDFLCLKKAQKEASLKQARKRLQLSLAGLVPLSGISLLLALEEQHQEANPYLLNQARDMVQRLKQSQVIDFQNDWKLITVFFSTEDLCFPCASIYQGTHLLDSMERLKGILDFLYEELPKAFVNLVDSTELRVSSLVRGTQNKTSDTSRKQCSCSSEHSRLDDVILRRSYQDAWEKLLESRRYDVKDDFTVVLQPFLQDINLPFRTSRQVMGSSISNTQVELTEGEHAALGVILWNNMMEPIGQKEPYQFTEMLQARCPSQEHPYFFTYKNSNYLSFPVTSHTEALSQERSYGTSIPCLDRRPSNSVPVSVHNLRPADIKVIAALGDSLTAGSGAASKPNDVLDVLTQYRGLSWSIGGNENISTVTTLPNILREFNPSLQGYSTGSGGPSTPNAFLNQAVIGDRAEDVPAQVRKLVDLMKSDARMNFQEDWKLVTLFIGGNDLCKFCNDPVTFSPENFTRNIQTALDMLHKEVPRTFVNLVTVIHIITLRELYQEASVKCPRALMRSLCPCLLKYDVNSTETEMLKSFNRRYQEGTHQLVESGRYDTKEDFTVVVQPFLEKVSMPKTKGGLPDASFFAPDCFHFHQKAHSQAARALWNNMLESHGEKMDAQAFEGVITLKCPSQAQPFLKTYKNSNITYSNETTPPLPSAAPPGQRPDENHGSQLLCQDRVPSISYPTSVHALKPADVRVIAALGDSLTAGNGIASGPNNLSDVDTEYRGLSWSVGGDASLGNVTTLPNIFREFNVNLTGSSTGIGNASEPNAFLNQAIPGAEAKGLPSQARTLVRLMKNDPRINFNVDWKIITVLIGANDLCNYCKDPNHYSAVNFTRHIQEALDTLHAEVPRAFVNLVEVMDLIPLRQMFQDSQGQCPTHLEDNLCGCVLPVKEDSQELVMVTEATRAYKESVQVLIESGRYDTRENFTVVVQPFFRNTKIPLLQGGRPDLSFFAPDCFHLNQKSHSQLSRVLWNTMLQPIGEKMESIDFTANIALSCPTAHKPFLGTYRNKNSSNGSIQNWGSDLLCPEQTVSKSVPTSVHELRPVDIKVIAALGDSLTTAVGAQATSWIDLDTAWRGLSWSIGGDGTLETHTTLPNILKKFNPNIFGFSTGTKKEMAGFNVAAAGAKALNMSTQARTLVELMRSSLKMNFKLDWKLITIFIGGNDLCQYCLDLETYSVEKYVKHLQDTLDILYKELPRAFVNLVEIMEISDLRQIERDASGCVPPGRSVCPCVLNPQDNSPELQEMRRINKDFQLKSMLMVNSGRYEQREDFTVVVQPFFRNTMMPLNNARKLDLSFFAVDCFHFAERGYAEMAMALWNNMLEPVGRKQSYNNFTYNRMKLKCPSLENPFLYTSRNSGLKNTVPSPEEIAVPYWAVIVAAAAGVLAGSLLVWAVLVRRSRKQQQKRQIATEIKSTFL